MAIEHLRTALMYLREWFSMMSRKILPIEYAMHLVSVTLSYLRGA
jgi:hypothetical protein